MKPRDRTIDSQPRRRLGYPQRLWLIVLLFSCVLPTTGSAAPDRSPPDRPLLTYVASNGGICLVRADGSHPVRLTPRWRRIGTLSWSPRGRYLAFDRAIDSDHSTIFVADARGRVRWRFPIGTGEGKHSNHGPLWSPDGRHIAYHVGYAHVGGLAVARPDGSHAREIASSPAFPTYGPSNPAWTADGGCLAFNDGNGVEAPEGIFRICLDGGERRLLVANATEPAFSPDGSKLAYVALGSAGGAGVFIADADGGNSHRLDSSPQAGLPAWSPDGTRVAFLRAAAIVVASVDGSSQEVIASQVPSLQSLAWSPGGKLIAFSRGRSIVVARADGGGVQTVLSRVNGVTSAPAWRSPAPLPAVKHSPCPRR
jgi:Tol biopolymer transport system component